MLNAPGFGDIHPTYQISGENPTGGKGCGNIPFEGQQCPTLSSQLKVHPFRKIQPGECLQLAEISGSGSIHEIFFTAGNAPNSLILRMYWDGETEPSVESPIGAFFANGFDNSLHPVQSLPVAVNPRCAFNCYWKMPFQKGARITLSNESETETYSLAYRILYQLYDVSPDRLYFHAKFHSSTTSPEVPVHTILDIKGAGVYVGTYIAWNSFCWHWWGEGEVKFYLDGDTRYPTLADNGAEDYFGGSHGFSPFNSRRGSQDEQPYSTAYLGMPLADISDPYNKKLSLYRWHIEDTIGFFQDIRVTIDTISAQIGTGLVPIADHLSSVAYWYQQKQI